jgi:hypothetical protein
MTAALTRQQLCAALSISESTVRRLELAGLPCTPVGRRTKRYDLAECQKWLRENQPCPSGSTAKVAGTSALWSAASAYIDGSLRAQRRVTPSALRPVSANQ